MRQDKPIKSIRNPCGISQSHIPATPVTLAGLSCSQLLLPLSPQPLPLLSQIVPSSKALTSLPVNPISSNLLTYRYQKRDRKPLPAQSSLVQRDFVSLLELPKDVINKQVSLPVIQEGHFFKLQYYFISLSLISNFPA